MCMSSIDSSQIRPFRLVVASWFRRRGGHLLPRPLMFRLHYTFMQNSTQRTDGDWLDIFLLYYFAPSFVEHADVHF